MSKIKQSVAWWCFAPNKLTPEQFVRAVADIGYDAVEIVPKEHIPLVIGHGLKVSAAVGHATLTNGFNRRDQHARIEQDIRDSLALAQQYGIPNLICFSGNRDGLSDDEGAAATAEGLARVAPLAEAAGVTLVLELLNSKVDHRDYQCDRTPWGVKVIEQVNSPAVKLLYDIYHMQIMEGDLIRTIRDCHAAFGHYHTAGNPGRNDLDETQEIYYPPIFKAIAATGYAGYIGHEFVPKGDPVAALKAAFELTAKYL